MRSNESTTMQLSWTTDVIRADEPIWSPMPRVTNEIRTWESFYSFTGNVPLGLRMMPSRSSI